MGPGLPRDLIIDCSDIGEFALSLDRVFHCFDIGEPLHPPRIEKYVLEVLAPNRRAVIPLTIKEEGKELLRLTTNQMEVLDMLDKVHRVAIAGKAGTGKTLVAVEKARRLANVKKKVLLLCFNRLLADNLKQQAQGFEVNTYHSLCGDLAKRAGLPDEPYLKGMTDPKFYREVAPNRLVEALEKLPDARYDAVIVDEGQDFNTEWWVSIEYLFSISNQRILYVFYDPNQNIYAGELPKSLGLEPITLRWNCRNTRMIAHYAAKQIGLKPEVKVGSPKGAPVAEIEYENKDEIINHVRKILHSLIIEKSIKPEQIVILTTQSVEDSVLQGTEGLNNVQIISIRRFKGLESDIVILCDEGTEKLEDLPVLLYIAASRACHRLFVLRPKLRKRKTM